MGLLDHFKHSHGKGQDEDDADPGHQQREHYQPPSGPPPGKGHNQNTAQLKQQQEERYQPPPGPPPGKNATQLTQHQKEQYQPPPGPPHRKQQEEKYQPPPGPPPGRREKEQYQPPPGPPPGKRQEEQYQAPPGPPPGYLAQQSKADEANSYQQHNWQAVTLPDSSLLPPPPALDHSKSTSSNAADNLASFAWTWTNQNPPFAPEQPHRDCIQDVRNGNLSLRLPERTERGEAVSKTKALCHIKTTSKSTDRCYLSSLPLYFEHADSPFRTETRKIIYYELKIEGMKRLRNGDDSTVAIGYAVAPYPTWRMPGWQRGSIAVHSDDGSRFTSHDGGGFDFTTPIRAGEVVGLGICFSIPEFRPDFENSGGQPLKGEVFFTRNGRPSGGWDIQEGLDDSQGWRADFLDGKWDLYAAIGTYGEVEVSVNFGAQHWQFDPSRFAGLPAWVSGSRN